MSLFDLDKWPPSGYVDLKVPMGFDPTPLDCAGADTKLRSKLHEHLGSRAKLAVILEKYTGERWDKYSLWVVHEPTFWQEVFAWKTDKPTVSARRCITKYSVGCRVGSDAPRSEYYSRTERFYVLKDISDAIVTNHAFTSCIGTMHYRRLALLYGSFDDLFYLLRMYGEQYRFCAAQGWEI